jgi:hypothetical protein
MYQLKSTEVKQQDLKCSVDEKKESMVTVDLKKEIAEGVIILRISIRFSQ